MPPDLALNAPPEVEATPGRWRAALAWLAAAWLVLIALTFRDWSAMAHQWWNIDTYNHILLVPGIIGWLVWMRHSELSRIVPCGWWPGLTWFTAGLAVWLTGHALGINLVAQTGVICAFQGAAMTILGLRATLALAFPMAYALFLVPFGDELIPALQALTARMTITLTQLSGVAAAIDGLFIDTPAGRFVVAEECAGVKFLIAMTALSVLAGWTGFTKWRWRVGLVIAAATISILANGVRAWGTIFVAQYIGIERAGGFDHIVYGWVFFAIVIAAVLGTAWRHFDREPHEAGLSASEIAELPVVRLERLGISQIAALGIVLVTAVGFAALARAV